MVKGYRFSDKKRQGEVSFPVKLAGKEKRAWVTVGGIAQEYVTDDPALQSAIESYPLLKGQIAIREIKGSAKEPVKLSPKFNDETAAEVFKGIQLPPSSTTNQGDGNSTTNPAPATNGEAPEEQGDGDGTSGDDAPAEQGDAPETTAYPNVIDINGAAAVLKGEPYNIAHQSLRTPEKVRAHAEVLGVSFPNWK